MADISVSTDGRDVLITTTLAGKRYLLTLETDEAARLAKRIADTVRITRLVSGPCS